MSEKQHYILFPNHDNGMRLHREMKALGIRAVIAPTPRSASKCCGISLIYQEEDREKIEKCIQENDIEILDMVVVEKDINPGRDRYC